MGLVICDICYGKGKIVGDLKDPWATDWRTPMRAKTCPKCQGDTMIDEDNVKWGRR